MDAQDVNRGNNNNDDDGGVFRIPERLLRREQARQEDAERRREAKEKQSVAEENSEFFIVAFNRDREAVEELMAACTGSDRDADTQTLDRAAAQTQELQKFLNDSVKFLAQYELRQAQASLQRLQTSLAEKRDEVLPKKKFAFRSRTKATEPVPAAVGPPPGPATAPDGVKADVTPHAEQCGFSNVTAAVLTKTSEEIDKQDVLLSHLTDCRVRLYGSPCTVHIKHVRGCEILCGPVSGSVFVDHCSDSTLAVACQQLRTHHTTATRVYLHVTSRAIVEDCGGVGFAPFTWSYPTLDRDFETSGLDRARNNWDQVDDFNWLAAGTPSPNWTVIAEEDRRTTWDL